MELESTYPDSVKFKLCQQKIPLPGFSFFLNLSSFLLQLVRSRLSQFNSQNFPVENRIKQNEHLVFQTSTSFSGWFVSEGVQTQVLTSKNTITTHPVESSESIKKVHLHSSTAWCTKCASTDSELSILNKVTPWKLSLGIFFEWQVRDDIFRLEYLAEWRFGRNIFF